MKVGDFVKFNSKISEAHRGMLSLERGVVVGHTHDRKAVRVVWSDGVEGTYRPSRLSRIDGGKIGQVVRDRKRPIKDRGHKPCPAPRPTTPIVPTPVKDITWAIIDETVVKGFPVKDRKTGEEKFMRLKVPIATVHVRATHWPRGSGVIVLSRSAKSIAATFPNGEKSSMTPTAARIWIGQRFAGDIADTLLAKMGVQEDAR